MLTRDFYLQRYGRLFTNTEGGGASGGGETGKTDEGAQGGGTEGQSNANAGGQQGGNGSTFEPITSQEALDELITKRLARQDAKTRKELTEQIRADLKREADANQAKEQGDFKKLYEATLAELETVKGELTAAQNAAMRDKVAMRHRLPETLAARLRGDTEEELEADAKELAKLVKTSAANTEAGAGSGTQSGPTKPSDRPIVKKTDAGATGNSQQGQPTHTFDGKPKVSWPTR